MKFSKKPFLLALALASVLPIIAVYEATELPAEEGNPALVKHGRGGRILSRKDQNLTCHENAPATFNSDGTTYTILPQTAQLAVDMDDVLFHLNKFNMTRAIIGNSPAALTTSLRIAADWIKYPFTKKRGKGIELTDNIRELARSGSAGGAYAEALDKFKPGLGKVVHTISSQSKDLIPGMRKILFTLKDNGYTMRPATNQSTQEFELSKQRWPEVLGLFDDGMTVNYSVRKNQPIIKKPNPQYFEELLAKCIIEIPETKVVIFIDDKEENIKAAARLGMIAIHFVSPRKLIKDLQALGLPTPSPMNDYNETALERMLK